MNELKKNIISMYNDEGKQWLDSLPKITGKIAKEHNLSGLAPLNNMTFNYVASGYQNDNPIILKISLNSKALTKEASCLKAFAKHGAAKVLAESKGMLLLERAIPGVSLRGIYNEAVQQYSGSPHDFVARDDEITKILCSSIKELHKAPIPESHNFYHLSELFKTLDQKLDIPDEILTKAKHLRDKLLSTTTEEVLLHGDLHHDNILKNGDSNSRRSSKSEDGWLVIDPKGFIGDTAFEPAAYLCNPIPELLQENQTREIIENRINICSAELGIDAQRIADWLYAKSVLCWAWSLEDNLDPSYWHNLLEMIEKFSSCT